MFFDVDSIENQVVLGDCCDVLPKLPDNQFQVIYIDPPFNTKKVQQRRTLVTRQSANGDRTGFQSRRYTTEEVSRRSYLDSYTDYVEFIAPHLEASRRLLKETGLLYLHLDYREAHYCKVLLDSIFGRENFLNEIIWAYDYGGRAKDRWPQKHDTILVYAKNMRDHYFNQDHIERIPYMAPGLVSAEKREQGKLPTDVWWHTIVPTNGKEKTGYPNQKPVGVLKRVIEPSSLPGDWVLDFFAGSGTTAVVARATGRKFVVADVNEEAVEVMRKRLGTDGITYRSVCGAPLTMEHSDSLSLF